MIKLTTTPNGIHVARDGDDDGYTVTSPAALAVIIARLTTPPAPAMLPATAPATLPGRSFGQRLTAARARYVEGLR
jgi:hypothetical protein